jgi:hypothetical protein
VSLWRKPPREVYHVYAEDDSLSEEGICPGECTVRPIDVDSFDPGGEGARSRTSAHRSAVLGGTQEHLRGPRSSGVAMLACLAAVTVVGVLVLFHLSHTPVPAKQRVAARHVSSYSERRAYVGEPATAPPKVHVPQKRQHKAHVPNSRLAHPCRPRRRISARHEEILKREVLGPQAPSLPAGHEFDFER